MVILKNNSEEEIVLMEYNHIVLKSGENKLELSPRRLGIAKKEIEKRKLPIEIIEEISKKGEKNGGKSKN